MSMLCLKQAALIAAWAGHLFLHAAWGKLVTALGPCLLSVAGGVAVAVSATALAYRAYKVCACLSLE